MARDRSVLAWSDVRRLNGTSVVVGSKNFTEQVVLGEVLAQAIEAEGSPSCES